MLVGAVSRKFDIPLPTYAQNMPGVMMMMMMMVMMMVMVVTVIIVMMMLY